MANRTYDDVARALVPTLAHDTVSPPRKRVETSLDTAGKSARATFSNVRQDTSHE